VLLLLVLGGLLFVGWRVVAPSTVLAGWYSVLEDGLDAAAAQDKHLLAFYTSDWWPPCQTFKRRVLGHEQVVEYLDDRFVCVRIDITDPRSHNTRTAIDHGVSTVPTLQVFNPDGTPIEIQVGGMSPGDLILWLQKCRMREKARRRMTE